MKIIKDSQIDLPALQNLLAKPALFTKSTAKFWDDEHISGQMLSLHLNPDIEAASKTKETVEAEAAFIISTAGMDAQKTVIDLGCGPGLYVTKFAETGAKVIGIDLSGRSINYADQTIKPLFPNTSFIKTNYLDIDFTEAFDIATLIFYDFCALNTAEQKKLLQNIHKALKNNGLFVFDIVSANWRNPLSDSITVYDGGFWRPDPHIEILSTFTYDEPKTIGRQYTIIAADGTANVIRLYIRLFSLSEITKLLQEHGFEVDRIYGNLRGSPASENTETYGIFARKT